MGGPSGPGGLVLAVMPVVTGDALLLVEDVVALDAGLVDRVDLGSAGHQVVVRHVGGRARSRAVVGREHAAAPGKRASAFIAAGLKRLLGMMLPGNTWRVTVPSALVTWVSRIVNRNLRAGRGDPFAEIAVIHFRRGDGEGRAVGAGAIAETFVGEEEERLVSCRDKPWESRRDRRPSRRSRSACKSSSGCRTALLKKLLASKSLLRRNS